MKEFFSTKDVFKTRNLAVMALMVALKMILGQFSIYVTPTFKLFSLAYLPGAMVSMLYGPWAGIAFGFVADTVGFLTKPAGPYFFGYALSEMAAGFIYAIFLYRKPINIWRVLLSRAAITVVVTFGLNFIWNVIMYGSVASKYFTGARLINNLIQLPISAILILLMGKLVLMIHNTAFQRGT